MPIDLLNGPIQSCTTFECTNKPLNVPAEADAAAAAAAAAAVGCDDSPEQMPAVVDVIGEGKTKMRGWLYCWRGRMDGVVVAQED